MPTKPKYQTLTGTSVEVLNAIRSNASIKYQDYVPFAQPNAESIREIGAIIMDYPALQNEFISALINRIGLVLITSKLYRNPLGFMKRGMLEFGETIEEIFVNLAKPFQYDPEVAETNVFKRVIPDVKSAFHVMNYKKFYKVTIMNDQLRTAFLSWEGITDLIARIVDSMYSGASYDEFQVMKYMVANALLKGHIATVSIPEVTSDNMKAVVSTVKGLSNNLEFMTDKYNIAGVKNYTEKADQYILLNANFDAVMDVEVLASAFNIDRAEFMGRRVLIDSFGSLDRDRLAELFHGDPTYNEISAPDLALLDKIPAVIVDKSWFMIFDNFRSFTENYNGEGLYWNYWYHVWETFSISPFANATAFVAGTPTVTSVAVSPETATVSPGGNVQLTATIVTENFAPQSVTWASSNPLIPVSPAGVVTVPSTVVAGETATITVTSTFDATKTATAVITVA